MARTMTSTSDERREALVASALRVFSRNGYAATPISDVAADAGISPAYVFKLFASKEALFVAAIDECFALIREALEVGAGNAATSDPQAVLDAMGGAYAELIARRELLMVQVHALAVPQVPAIAAALRRGLGLVTGYAQQRSGGTDDQVQRFIAFGQLCHLLTAADLFDEPAAWATALTQGVRHAPVSD